MSNWSKLDMFLPLALVREDNSLTDIVGGKKAVNNGATKVFEGFEFDGVSSFIDTTFNPALHLRNKNDLYFDCFLYDFDSADFAIGANTSANDSRYSTYFRQGLGQLNYQFSNSFARKTGASFPKKAHYSQTHTPDQIINGYLEGVINATSGVLPHLLPDDNLYAGARNADDSIQLAMNGIQSIISAGAAVGVNQIAKNDHIRQFLTDLGINLTPSLEWVEIINTGNPEGSNISLSDTTILIGQTFTTIDAQTNLKVEMYGSISGSPVANIEMVLAPLVGGDPDFNNIIAISDNKLDVSTFPTSDARLEGFIFTGISLNATTEYALVPRYVDVVTIDSNNRVNVTQGPTTPTYAEGLETRSFDSGATWTPNFASRSNAYLIYDLQ